MIERKKLRISAAAWSACLAMFLTSTGQAAWDVIPQAGLFVESTDNVSLRTEGKQEANRTFLDARVNAVAYNERGEIFFEPRLVSDRYKEEVNKRFESDDLFFRSAGSYGWRAANAGYSGSFSRQQVISSEFVSAEPEDPDVEEPPDVETGRVAINQNRERVNFGTNVDFRLSERNRLRVRAQYIDVEYTKQELSGRTSFDDKLAAFGIIRRVDELNEVSAEFFTSEYNAVLNQNVTNTSGVEGRFSRPLSEIWRLTIRTGVQRSDFNFLDSETGRFVDNADTNFTFDIGLRRRSDRVTTNFNLSRRVTPNAIGYMVERDELWIFTRRLFTERFSGSLGLRASETRSLGDVSVEDDRYYFRFQIGGRWLITRTLEFAFGYYLTRQQFINEEVDEATAHLIQLGINFRGLERPRL